MLVVLSAILAGAGGFVLGYVLRTPARTDRLVAKEEQRLKRLLKTGPNDPNVLRGLAAVYLHQGKHEEALRYAKKAVSVSEDDAENWKTCGICLSVIYAKECSDASKPSCESIRNGLKEAGCALLRLCKSRRARNEESASSMWELCGAEDFLREAGEKEGSEEAHALALEIAKKWAQSKSQIERELGEFHLKRLIENTVQEERPFFSSTR